MSDGIAHRERNGGSTGPGERSVPVIEREATEAFADRVEAAQLLPTGEAWARVAPMLGARPVGETCEIAIWTPSLVERGVPSGDVFVEVLDPDDALDLTVSRQAVRFRRTLVPTVRRDDVTLAVVRGMRAGRRDRVGTFYALVWRDAEGREHRILDPLAASLPFGAFAPSELYDVDAMLGAREDADWFGRYREAPRAGPPTAILQVHVPTATLSGTLAGLARLIRGIGERVASGAELSASDRLWLGYDAVQLLPVEPTTVYEAGPAFWEDRMEGDALVADLRRPDTTNWGYDVVIAGSAAVNPCLLETGRPDELVDLAEALHGFPGTPKMLIFDVVFGHADNQALDVLDPHFLAGPNMYGQNMAYRKPGARAIMLEMQRRKVNFGADGVRVDGAQDFKWWDSTARVLRHDDEYLVEMFEMPQEAGGVPYKPWFVFEDGRPWPEEDWELASTYRAVTELLDDPDVFQWGPLTFAHNTPFLYTFWLSKLWRIRQIMEWGASWISGCSNHDTLRRGTQVDPQLNVNTRLGSTLMEVLDKAYDNPAVQMFTFAACPGVPMDFLNASARASWGFVRNQDDRWGVKVVAEEAISLKWQVDEPVYDRPVHFQRLKAMGFGTLDELRRFMDVLPSLVTVTGYDLPAMVRLVEAVDPPLAGGVTDVASLKAVARAWMDDMHEFVNASHSNEHLGETQTRYNQALRELRAARPWLRRNLGEGEGFDYRRPVDGSVVFETRRRGPDGEALLVLTHMEGAPVTLGPLRDPLEDGGRYELLLETPGLNALEPDAPLTLIDSTGVVLRRV